MTLRNSCNIARINFGGLAILKLCLVTFMIMDISKAQNNSENSINIGNSLVKMNSTNGFIETDDRQLLHILPFRMDKFYQSLRELEIEENHNAREKKSIKRNDKKIQATEMRDRIKDLMSNISRTLNDVDWYFSYEQLDDEKNKEKEYYVSEPTQKFVIKRMREVDSDTSDVFVDSFVRQMYDLDPSILDKINDRIASEFSSDKEEQPINCDLPNVKRAARLASTANARRAKVSTIKVSDDYPYVDDVAADEMLTKIPNFLNGVDKMFKHKDIAKLLAYDANIRETTTTTTEATTYENFYDYGDYYKESEEDKLRGVAHYEIVQDVLHSTLGVNKDYDADSFKVPIIKKSKKNKKTRSFHKNKEMLKKKLKNKLENFELKNYKGYNIDSD